MALAAASPRLETRWPGEARAGGMLLAVAVAFSLYMTVVAFLDVGHYAELIREDGLVEYASAGVWVLAALLMLYRLGHPDSCRLNGGYRLVNLVGLAVLFIVCGGEEISWGQRILGLETPRVLDEINVQHEINLHDVGSISIFENLFFLIAVTFFLVVPYWWGRSRSFRRLLDYLRFPVPNRFATYVFVVSLAAWVLIGVRFGTLGFHPFSVYPERYYTQMDDEFFELMVAFAFLCFSALEVLKRVTAEKEHSR